MKNVGFIIATLIAAGLLQVSSVFAIAGESGWLAVAVATLLIVPLCLLYKKLTERHGPGVFPKAFGELPGKIINLLYVLFFVFSASVDLRQIGNLVSGGMFTGLSPLIIALLFLPILFYAGKKDAVHVAELGFLIFVISGLMLAGDILLQSNQIKFFNYLPLLSTTGVKFFQAVLYCLTVAMGKIPVILFILPKAKSGWVAGGIAGGVFLLLSVVRDAGILGVLTPYLSNPGFETVQLLDAFGFLSRIEIIFVFVHLVCVTYVLCLWVGISGDIICHSFSVKRKNNFVIGGVALAVAAASVFVFTTSAILRTFLINIFPYVALCFVVVLPFTALVFGKK